MPCTCSSIVKYAVSKKDVIKIRKYTNPKAWIDLFAKVTKENYMNV